MLPVIDWFQGVLLTTNLPATSTTYRSKARLTEYLVFQYASLHAGP